MKVSNAILVRTKDTGEETFGHLYLFGDNGKLIFQCVVNELPWKENKRRISCIPAGFYILSFRTIGKYAFDSYHITNIDGSEVSERSDILLHYGNFEYDTLGCVLAGETFYDIDKDGDLDITNSKTTMRRLIQHIGKDDSIPLQIIYRDGFEQTIVA